MVAEVEGDGVLQGNATLPEEERAQWETVNGEQACAGRAGAVGYAIIPLVI